MRLVRMGREGGVAPQKKAAEEKGCSAAAAAAAVPEVKTGRLRGALRAGSIVFAKQGKFPWWPGMVTYDPFEFEFCRLGSGGTIVGGQYHLLFFGNVPQRAWVAANHCRSWEGSKGAGPEILYQQKIPKKYLAEWPAALRFAEEAHRMPHLRRLGAFGWIEDLRQLDEGLAGSSGDEEAEEEDEDDDDEEASGSRSRKRKRRRHKDPDAPKRPKSSYMHFCAEKRAALVDKNPEMKVTEIVKALGTMWNELSIEQRAGYDQAAAADKGRYQEQMATYTPPAEPKLPPKKKKQRQKKKKAAAKKADGAKGNRKDNEAAVANELMCGVCEEGGQLMCCEGGCRRSFHLHCLGLTTTPPGAFVCDACETGVETCLACYQLGEVDEMLGCSHDHCGKWYHKQCARELPRASSVEAKGHESKEVKFLCPRHNCANSGLPEGKGVALLQCARCPIAYHEEHVPAGCTIYGDNILCPKHYDLLEPGRKPPTLLACVVCGDGGDLVCCDTCPGCYHEDCIRGKLGFLDLGQGAQKLWRCPDCVNGTKACVGDVVWVKVGKQRFFPAIIKDEKDWPTPSADEVATGEMSLATGSAEEKDASTEESSADATATSAAAATAATTSSIDDEESRKLDAKLARKKAKEEALKQEQLDYEAYLQELLEKRREGEFPVQFLWTEEWAWANHTNSVRWEKGDEKGRFTVGAKAELREAVQLAIVAHDERCAAVASKRAELELILAADAKPQPYKKIKTNIYTMQRPWLKSEREKNAACMCTADHPCNDERCLNSSTLVECDPKTCPVGDACRNRHFQRRDGPKVASFPTPGRGFGLMTKESISEGDFCLEYMGEVITSEECGRRMHDDGREGEGAFYMLALEGDQIIDARPAANLARFANHSCDPNMVMKKWNVLGQTRAGLFACKDIAAGDELTWNYQLDSFEGHAKMPCLCGAANCSGWIGMKPKELESPTTNQPPKKKRRTKAKKSAASPTGDELDVKASDTHLDKGVSGDGDDASTKSPKQKRKPKYLMRLVDDVDEDAASSEKTEMLGREIEILEGESEVSQPLVGADIQLHSFGEPLPNVWAMKATGEWEAFESRRAEQERKKELIKENERKKEEAKQRAAERKAREFWDAQTVFGLRRGCWERGLVPHGEPEKLLARILAFDYPAMVETTGDDNGSIGSSAATPSLWDESERAKAAAAIKKQWSKVGLNPAIKGCRERRIWPGGHLPELRDRLLRFDTGQSMSEAELQEFESEAEEESDEEEIDSEEEREIEAEKERKRKEREAWNKLTPAEQAAFKAAEKERAKAERKAQLEALHERMRTLRQSPPEACLNATTGKVDPLQTVTSGKRQFPKEWVDGWAATAMALWGKAKSAGKSKKGASSTVAARPLPSNQELMEWTPEALSVFWEVRFKFWESRKLVECQKACVSRSLSNAGETFDIRLRSVKFEIGGGPRLLDLDELAEPLHTTEKKSRRAEQKHKEAEAAEAKKRAQRERSRIAMLKQKALDDALRKGIPKVTHGEIDMIDSSSDGLKPEVEQTANRTRSLPAPQVLRTWTLESQHRFWEWRWEYWGRKKLKDLQVACKKFDPPIWPGGDARDVRVRLCKAEFDPGSLKAAEWGVFFTLADRWIEVDFGEDGWFLGYVEKQVGVELLVQWSTGDSEWIGDLESPSDYRIIENPRPEQAVGLVIQQMLTSLEHKEAEEEEAAKQRAEAEQKAAAEKKKAAAEKKKAAAEAAAVKAAKAQAKAKARQRRKAVNLPARASEEELVAAELKKAAQQEAASLAKADQALQHCKDANVLATAADLHSQLASWVPSFSGVTATASANAANVAPLQSQSAVVPQLDGSTDGWYADENDDGCPGESAATAVANSNTTGTATVTMTTTHRTNIVGSFSSTTPTAAAGSISDISKMSVLPVITHRWNQQYHHQQATPLPSGNQPLAGSGLAKHEEHVQSQDNIAPADTEAAVAAAALGLMMCNRSASPSLEQHRKFSPAGSPPFEQPSPSSHMTVRTASETGTCVSVDSMAAFRHMFASRQSDTASASSSWSSSTSTSAFSASSGHSKTDPGRQASGGQLIPRSLSSPTPSSAGSVSGGGSRNAGRNSSGSRARSASPRSSSSSVMSRTAAGAGQVSPSIQAPPVSWSEEENARLRAAVATWGTSSWAKVAELVGNGRAVQACRGRWRRLLAADAESAAAAVGGTSGGASEGRVSPSTAGRKRKRNTSAVVQL